MRAAPGGTPAARPLGVERALRTEARDAPGTPDGVPQTAARSAHASRRPLVGPKHPNTHQQQHQQVNATTTTATIIATTATIITASARGEKRDGEGRGWGGEADRRWTGGRDRVGRPAVPAARGLAP